MGATITAVGMPASLSWRTASRRFAGVAARGSMARAMRLSSVVTDSATLARPRSAMRCEDVDVAHDQRRLGHDADGMAGALQHLQDRARDLPLALDRLIGIGVGAERDGVGLIARMRQLALQQLGRVRLGVELGLEVEAGRVPEKAMGGTRVAVDAAVLAAAIGIDRAVEGDVGAVVARDDGARRLLAHLGLEGVEVAQALPAVIEGLALLRLEAAGRVRARAAPAPPLRRNRLVGAVAARRDPCAKDRRASRTKQEHKVSRRNARRLAVVARAHAVAERGP